MATEKLKLSNPQYSLRVWRWDDAPDEYVKQFPVVPEGTFTDDVYLMCVPILLHQLKLVHDIWEVIDGTASYVSYGSLSLMAWREPKPELIKSEQMSLPF